MYIKSSNVQCGYLQVELGDIQSISVDSDINITYRFHAKYFDTSILRYGIYLYWYRLSIDRYRYFVIDFFVSTLTYQNLRYFDTSIIDTCRCIDSVYSEYWYRKVSIDIGTL